MTHWSGWMDPNLHGRSVWVCERFLRLHVPSVLVFVSYLCSHTQKHSHFYTLVFRIVDVSVISGIKENIKYSHL